MGHNIYTIGYEMLWSACVRGSHSSPWHEHAAYEFIFCRSDGGGLELEGGTVSFRLGRTLLVPPGLRHSYRLASGEAADLKVICMTAQDMATFCSPALRAAVAALRGHATWADHREAAEPLWQLAALVPAGPAEGDGAAVQVAWGAMGLLLALHCQRRAAIGTGDGRYRERIRTLCLWLETKLDEAVSLEEAAAQAGLSRSLLTREFRRYTGQSLVDYCNGRRVEKAAAILLSPAGTVTRAALESGFSNLSHFHRQFKAVYGLTPAAYRRQVRPSG